VSEVARRIRRIRFGTNFVIIAILVFVSVSPLSAQSGGAVVRPDAPSFEIGQGQVETINIVIDNAKDAYGIEVRAKFDPAVIEVVDADPAQEGLQMIPGAFIKPDFLVRNTADNQKGTLQYVITQVNPSTPVSGNGIVFSIQFRGKTLGKKTTLAIDFVEIADRQGRKLPVKGQSQALSVVQPKPPTPTPPLSTTPTLVPTQVSLPVVNEPEPTSNAAPPKSASNSRSSGLLGDISILEIALVLIACGGFVGAFVLVGIAAVFLWRRPARRR
jgi:hypothetical protein